MTNRSLPRVGALVLAVLLLHAAAAAQWSASAATNLAVASRPNEQVQAKIRSTADGGCYVSWFDSDPAGSPAFGYDVRLQRLDPNGWPQWPSGGILIADRGFSSTQDYDLDVDAAGNALLAFNDDRGGPRVTATKVSPAGVQLWGSTGISVDSSATAFFGPPKIAATSDGFCVVAWTRDTVLNLQKLDLYGNSLWGTGVTLSELSATYMAGGLAAGDNGSVIASWVRSTTFSAPKYIKANKLSAIGALMWGSAHVSILDNGSVQFGNFPGCISDGSGGAVWGWYTSTPSLQCWTQHVLANGTEAFPHNGAAASLNAAQLRVSPDVAYDPLTSETYLFWKETNQSQGQQGISGQKFDAAGNRLWSANGVTVTPLSGNQIIWVNTLFTGTRAQAAWIEQQGTSTTYYLRAARYDAAGNVVCAPFMVSSAPSNKSRLAGTLNAFGVAHYAWQDTRNDAGDIYAQNVNPDCTLGGVYPGTREDFIMASGTGGALSTIDVKLARPSQVLSVGLRSTTGAFAPFPPLLVAQFFPTGTPAPVWAAHPEIHLDPFGPSPLIFILDGSGAPFGFWSLPLTISVIVPAGLSGSSLMFQALSPAGAVAANASYAVTDGHEIRFVP